MRGSCNTTAVAALHHEVLNFWAQYRRCRDTAPEVLCFDFHTDTLCAAHRGGPDATPGVWQNGFAISRAVEQLHHDEHFDWALRCGMISRARIVALAPCAGVPEHPDLQVIRPPEVPDMEIMLNEPEQFRPLAEKVLTDEFITGCLGQWRPEPGFILDIDCDFFMVENALFPENSAVFDGLLETAGLLTLSCEEDWIKILRLPGESFSGAQAAEILRKRRDEIAAAHR